jgi:hypothetical protein
MPISIATETVGQAHGRRPLLWRPGQRKTVYFGTVVLAVAAFFANCALTTTWQGYQQQVPGHPMPYGDFFALWSYGEVLKQFPAAILYHGENLHQIQVVLGMNPASWNPFPYPPLFMPLAKTYGLLPYNLSYVVWEAATLVLLLGVSAATGYRSLWSMLAIAVAPFSTLTIGGGQTGFLAGALILLSLRLSSTRPLLSGVALGLLAYKPQLAVLLPVAFLAAGAWRVLLAAAATALCLSVLATLQFGWEVWSAWIAMLPHYHTSFVAEDRLWRLQPTLIAALHGLGVSGGVGTAAQLAVLFLSVVATWRLCRVASPDRAAPAIIFGCFVATPHAFYYDMPVVVAGMTLLIGDRLRRNGGLSTHEIILLAATTLAPVYLVGKTTFVPIVWPCLALLTGMAMVTAFRDAAAQPRR